VSLDRNYKGVWISSKILDYFDNELTICLQPNRTSFRIVPMGSPVVVLLLGRNNVRKS
jgi:hypothetical protein